MKSSSDFVERVQQFIKNELLQFFANAGTERDICSFILSAVVEKLYEE